MSMVNGDNDDDYNEDDDDHHHCVDNGDYDDGEEVWV